MLRRRFCSAGVALDQTHFVTMHTFESDEFGGEVVPVHRLLAAVAHVARQQTITATNLAHLASIGTLQQTQTQYKQLAFIFI